METIQISSNEGLHYFEVLFFDTQLEMFAWTRANKPGAPDDFGALTCARYPKGEPETGLMGQLLFCAEHFAPSILQHELLHAAFAYERRVYGNTAGSFPTAESEERICHTQQDLLDDLLFKMEEAGLEAFGCVES